MPIRCESAASAVTRIPEVGDVWLDAGIVPFSTLGWENPEWIPEGYATGAARGLTKADLPDHAYWEKWFPADWVSRDARADPALVLLAVLHVGACSSAARRTSACSATRRCSTRRAREMHASWGNTIAAEDAFAQMGADVMRWQYCAQPPDRNLLFGFGPGARDQAHACSRSGTPSSSSSTTATSRGSRRLGAARARRRACSRSTAGSSRARSSSCVDATAGVRGDARRSTSIRAFEAFVDDVSNWYIRRSRRRFYSFDEAAFRTLWYALVQSLRVVAPVMPFLTDHLWRNLVQDGPASVHLAPWPEAGRAGPRAARRDRRGAARGRARPPGALRRRS